MAGKRQTNLLQGHTGAITSLSYSADGVLLAAKSVDGTVSLWSTDRWERVALLPEPVAENGWRAGLTFHPQKSLLATLGDRGREVRLWRVDAAQLLSLTRASETRHYTNAKVVVAGDTGVGKSALAQILAGKAFTPTESTHGRRVVTLLDQQVDLGHGRSERRETLLWDLAGQPNYRLIHQLHLDQVSVALVLFDARSGTDPFAGVMHWARALKQAERLQPDGRRVHKFLVASRCDVSAVSVGNERIGALLRDTGFDGYFQTSAKTGLGIIKLADAIAAAIDWNTQIRVTSNELFVSITAFLLAEKEQGRLLPTAAELCRSFLQSSNAPAGLSDPTAEIATCVRLLESQGLVQRLSFGDFVLLQPEYIDAYASTLVNAALQQPDGVGTIPEADARSGNFLVARPEREISPQYDELLRLAAIETLLRHEIALRMETADGTLLVFPAQYARARADMPEPPGKAGVYTFEGPLLNVYATLVVRLTHTGIFESYELWRNAATFTARNGSTYGIYLREIEEGRAELGVFFGGSVPPGDPGPVENLVNAFVFEPLGWRASREQAWTHAEFIRYVQIHLQRYTLPEKITWRHVVMCPSCQTPFSEQAVRRRLDRGLHEITCPVCDYLVKLNEPDDQSALSTEKLARIDKTTDASRERSTASAVVAGKRAARRWDVVLCYDQRDAAEVRDIAAELQNAGILPWLDEAESVPGEIVSRQVEGIVERAAAVVMILGRFGRGGRSPLNDALWEESRRRNLPALSVLLADAPRQFLPLADGMQVSRLSGSGAEKVRPLVQWLTHQPAAVPPGAQPSGVAATATRNEAVLYGRLQAALDSGNHAVVVETETHLARLHLDAGKTPDATVLLTDALLHADNPALAGSKFREPLLLLLGHVTAAVIAHDLAWLPDMLHRAAFLDELRAAPPEHRAAAILLLRHMGIQQWAAWFGLPPQMAERLPPTSRGGPGWPAVRLLRLRLRNIKSFDDLTLDFREIDGAPRTCYAFVGDNATGKTTLLQTIAVAALGPQCASKLPGRLAGRLLRNEPEEKVRSAEISPAGATPADRKEKEGEIEAEFELRIDPLNPETEKVLDAEIRQAEALIVAVGIHLDRDQEDFRALPAERMQFGLPNSAAHWDTLRGMKDFDWGLCCGYGTFRNLRERVGSPSSGSDRNPPEIDRLLSLFYAHAALLEPSLLERLLQDGDVSAFSPNRAPIPLPVRTRLLAMFRQIIPGLEIEVEGNSRRLVEVHGATRVHAFTALSDGCNSMFGLLGHLTRHALEISGWTSDPQQAAGMVLIDEIDIHLHPSWQRRVLAELQSAFPRMQFIITTHSPLALGGVPDGRVTVLRRNEESRVCAISNGPSVKGWRVDQMLNAFYFDTFSYDLETERLTETYARTINDENASQESIAAARDALETAKSDAQASPTPGNEAARLLNVQTQGTLAAMDPERRTRVLAEILNSFPTGN